MTVLRKPRLSNVLIDDEHPMLQYTGNWTFISGAQINGIDPFNNSLHQTSPVGDTVKLEFYGSFKAFDLS